MIAENIAYVRAAIDRARQNRKKARDEEVTLVAVTKNHPVEAMQEALAAGIENVGENRVQEAMEKQSIVGRTPCWHLIGHLQTNKAKQAVTHFDLIHSIDSAHLADAVDRAAAGIDKVQDVLVQVNLAEEETKSGIFRAELMDLLLHIDERSHLRLCGLMCMAPHFDDVEQCRPIFKEMNNIFQRVKEMDWRAANIKYLSMGMTNDYRVAIEEGANLVRVGTAIFGARSYEGRADKT